MAGEFLCCLLLCGCCSCCSSLLPPPHPVLHLTKRCLSHSAAPLTIPHTVLPLSQCCSSHLRPDLLPVVFRLSRTLTFPSSLRLSILAAVCIALALRSVARPSLLSLDLSHDGLAAPCSAMLLLLPALPCCCLLFHAARSASWRLALLCSFSLFWQLAAALAASSRCAVLPAAHSFGFSVCYAPRSCLLFTTLSLGLVT